MTLTAFRMEARKEYLGASDMAAVLGLSKYKSAYDVWLEKTERVPVNMDNNKATDAGIKFEEGVLAFAEERLGKIRRNQFRKAPEGIPIGATCDAIVVDTDEPVEAKTAGLFSPLDPGWGNEEGSDEVPEPYIIQAQAQILCVKADVKLCWMPAFLGGRGFRMFAIPRNQDLIDLICEKAVEFWTQYVQADKQPPSVPSIDMVKRMRRLPEKVAAIDPQFVDQWQKAKEAAKQAEEAAEEAQAALLAQLGDAETAELIGRDGQLLTYFEERRPRLDQKKLREELPDVHKKYYIEDATARVLRLKKQKKGA